MFRNFLGYLSKNKKDIITTAVTGISFGTLTIFVLPCIMWGSIHTMNYLEKRFPLNSPSTSFEQKK